jgi:hypothetical protein
VYSGGEFLGERLVDEALPCQAALATKGGGNDGHRKVRFTFGPRSGMPGVAVRLINDLKPDWGKTVGQLATDRIGDRHLKHPGV